MSLSQCRHTDDVGERWGWREVPLHRSRDGIVDRVHEWWIYLLHTSHLVFWMQTNEQINAVNAPILVALHHYTDCSVVLPQCTEVDRCTWQCSPSAVSSPTDCKVLKWLRALSKIAPLSTVGPMFCLSGLHTLRGMQWLPRSACRPDRQNIGSTVEGTQTGSSEWTPGTVGGGRACCTGVAWHWLGGCHSDGCSAAVSPEMPAGIVVHPIWIEHIEQGWRQPPSGLWPPRPPVSILRLVKPHPPLDRSYHTF